MTTPWIPAPLILKEGRALMPIWLGAAATIVAGTGAGMLMGSLLAFVLGAAALGVFSIGHEYANRTLTSLLAQPLGRSRLLLSKLVVLAPLLILLSLVAAFVLFRAEGAERMLGGVAPPVYTTGDLGRFGVLAAQPVDATLVSRWRLTILVLTPLLGLCVAPWLTMVFRNVTAGLVFTLAIPAALWIAGQIGRAASVDFDFVALEVGSAFGYAPALILMVAGVLVVTGVAAVHGRTLFVGLEALDTPRDLLPSLPKRRAQTAIDVATPRVVRPRSPFLLFLQKEVRLYGLAFALAGFYVIGWLVLWLAGAAALLADDTFEAIAGMYGLFIALLVGAMSIAEERALRTADTQSLQPWPRWKQALAKLSTVGVISLLLGLAVPAALQMLLPLIESSRGLGPDLGLFRFLLPNPLNSTVATMLLAALFSCYISSLSSAGLRALLGAMPLSFGLAALYAYLFVAFNGLERMLLARHFGPEWQTIVWKLQIANVSDSRMLFLYSRWMAAAAFLGFAAILLALFVRNFRSGERGMAMARKQLPWLPVYAVVSMALTRGGESFLEWWLLTH